MRVLCRVECCLFSWSLYWTLAARHLQILMINDRLSHPEAAISVNISFFRCTLRHHTWSNRNWWFIKWASKWTWFLAKMLGRLQQGLEFMLLLFLLHLVYVGCYLFIFLYNRGFSYKLTLICWFTDFNHPVWFNKHVFRACTAHTDTSRDLKLRCARSRGFINTVRIFPVNEWLLSFAIFIWDAMKLYKSFNSFLVLWIHLIIDPFSFRGNQIWSRSTATNAASFSCGIFYRFFHR